MTDSPLHIANQLRDKGLTLAVTNDVPTRLLVTPRNLIGPIERQLIIGYRDALVMELIWPAVDDAPSLKIIRETTIAKAEKEREITLLDMVA